MSENKPIKKFGAGVISASVWRNELKDGSTIFAVTIERRYQNKGGDWQSTSNLRMNDLPKVSMLADKAFEFLACGQHGDEKEEEA